MKLENVTLLLSDARGIYIPANFVEAYNPTDWHVKPEDAAILAAGPDHELYWDTWSDVEQYAYYVSVDGRRFTLYQDGDLWALCLDHMTDEERENFGFDPIEERDDYATFLATHGGEE